MSLPRLKDYLSRDFDQVPPAPATREAKAALDEYERSLDRIAGKLLRLRDRLLVQEAQEMSAGTFWDDDDR